MENDKCTNTNGQEPARKTISLKMKLLAIGIISTMVFLSASSAIPPRENPTSTPTAVAAQPEQPSRAKTTGIYQVNENAWSGEKPWSPLNHQSNAKVTTYDSVVGSTGTGIYGVQSIACQVVDYVDWSNSDFSTLRLRIAIDSSLFDMYIDKTGQNTVYYFVSQVRLEVSEPENPDFSAVFAHDYMVSDGLQKSDSADYQRAVDVMSAAASLISVAVPPLGYVAAALSFANMFFGIIDPADKYFAERGDPGIQLSWKGNSRTGLPETTRSVAYSDLDWLVYDNAACSQNGVYHQIQLKAIIKIMKYEGGGLPYPVDTIESTVSVSLIPSSSQPVYLDILDPCETMVFGTTDPFKTIPVLVRAAIDPEAQPVRTVEVYCDGVVYDTVLTSGNGYSGEWTTNVQLASDILLHYIQARISGGTGTGVCTPVRHALLVNPLTFGTGEGADLPQELWSKAKPWPPVNHQSNGQVTTYSDFATNNGLGTYGGVSVACKVEDYADWSSLGYGTLRLRVAVTASLSDDYLAQNLNEWYSVDEIKLEVLETGNPAYTSILCHNFWTWNMQVDDSSPLDKLVGALDLFGTVGTGVNILHKASPSFTFWKTYFYDLKHSMGLVTDNPFSTALGVVSNIQTIHKGLGYYLGYADKYAAERYDSGVKVTWKGLATTQLGEACADLDWHIYDNAPPSANGYHELQLKATAKIMKTGLGPTEEYVSTYVTLALNPASGPGVSIDYPIEGAQINAIEPTMPITVRAIAGADPMESGVSAVRLYCDGVTYNAALTEGDDHYGTWTATISMSSAVPRQVHFLQAEAAGGEITTVTHIYVADTNKPPSIDIIDPPDGTTFYTTFPGDTTKSVYFGVQAGDAETSVTNVQLYCDGQQYSLNLASGSYSDGCWNTVLPLSVGPHTVYAIAYDTRNFPSTTSPITVYVSDANTPPTVSITEPPEGSSYDTVNGKVTLRVFVEAADAETWVANVQVSIDGGNTWLSTTHGSGELAGYIYRDIDFPSGKPAIQYTIKARAYDTMQSIGYSPDVHISVLDTNQPPTLYFTDPSDGATMSGPTQYTFHVYASDPEYGFPGITEVLMLAYDVNDPEGDIPPLYAATHGSGGDWYYTFTISGDTTWEISARATDSVGKVTCATIHVIVHDTPRFTYTPPDMTVQTRDQFTLKWTATSTNPARNYVIYLGSTQVASGNWQSYTDILYTASQSAIGSYTYTIWIYNTAGNYQLDSVTVTVADNAAPVFFVRPGSITYERGTTGHTLTWQAGDHNPGTYEITYYPQGHPDESALWASGSWTNSTMITTNVDGLPAITWYFVCTVKDAYGHTAASTVSVTVQLIPPTFTYTQPDITVEIGQSFTLRWRATDATPGSYVIARNGAQVASGTWANGVDISYTSSLGSGAYTFTITIYDNGGSSAVDSAIVTVVVDAYAPTFTYRQPNIVSAIGAPFTLKWTATDAHPSTYTITRNGVQIASGSWQSGVPITKTTSCSGAGTFTYTCTVYDSYGHSSSASCTVTIKNYY